ncbi:hypothetical protein FHX80_112459 [Streptomyces brevispora]|uniref:Uncharacterized protein n=1 Tax=Streptomyces brevispora TaxID=887462 RepID=A0A561UXC4_9ACTN|nr:hypothetical protein FHX80_112459 [Streptomyces brevispora]
MFSLECLSLLGDPMTDPTEPQDPDEAKGIAGQIPAPATVPAQGAKKAKRPSPRPDVFYTPVSNGMDYLVSVLKHLTEGETPPSARDLPSGVSCRAAPGAIMRTASASCPPVVVIGAAPG